VYLSEKNINERNPPSKRPFLIETRVA